MQFTIKSMMLTEHDRGYGGYKYKVIVKIDMPVKEYNKLKPLGRSRFTGQSRGRDLGPLVLDVGNEVYRLNKNIPAYNPSIDSKGSKRAKNGIKSMEFVYFFNDSDKAEAMGMQRLGDDCFLPRIEGQFTYGINLLNPPLKLVS